MGAVVQDERGTGEFAHGSRALDTYLQPGRASLGGLGGSGTSAGSRPRGRAVAVIGGALGLAILLPTLAVGGYTTSSRLLFVTLAGVCLVCAALLREAAARALARTAPVATLGALAVLSAASAAWSIAPAASLRWSLAIAAYAAVAVAAGVLSRERGGVEVIATLIAVTALVCAVLGLIGYALHQEPFAQQIYGRWRPGGPFEYPPTLALVQVSALPVLLFAMTHARRALATVAAAGAALAVGTIAVSGSRWQLVLGVAVLALAPAVARRGPAAGGRPALLATSVVGACGAAFYGVGALPGLSGPLRLGLLLAVCAAGALAWAIVPAHVASRRLPRPDGRIAVAAIGIALAVFAGLSIADLTARTGARDPATHGRLDRWRDATDTALRRPVSGYGADTYSIASKGTRATAPARYAHNLPLEAWAELGLAGIILVIGLYGVVVRAAWRARSTLAGLLLGPAALAFLATNLLDWPWHQAGAGALWAAAVGAIAGASRPHMTNTQEHR